MYGLCSKIAGSITKVMNLIYVSRASKMVRLDKLLCPANYFLYPELNIRSDKRAYIYTALNLLKA